MSIKYRGSNTGGFNRSTEAVKRPAPVSFPEAVAQIVTTHSAEICDFGSTGAHVTILHGTLLGVPFSGDIGSNGPDTPRFTFETLDKFLRAQGLLAVPSQNRSATSRHGEAYTIKVYVKAE